MECMIGEIRKVGDKWLQCIEGTCNKECYFYNRSLHKTIAGINGNDFGACNACFRDDNKSVIFKELEKIGEPYDDYGTILQRFKIYTNVTNANTKGLELHIYSDDTIGIEIKGNKKDMKERYKILEDLVSQYMEADIGYKEFEEGIEKWYKEYGKNTKKKLNFKSFNFEAAKAGKSVCTRNGRKARIVCFDRVDVKPILALIASTDGKGEDVFDYFVSGKRIANALESDLDLMMLPEKKEGWINIYKGGLLDTKSYNTKEEAFDKASPEDYVDTVKINWSE